MNEKPMQLNWITGEYEDPKQQDPDAPSDAWISGWTDGMNYGKSAVNPYPEGSTERREWRDGFEAALAD